MPHTRISKILKIALMMRAQFSVVLKVSALAVILTTGLTFAAAVEAQEAYKVFSFTESRGTGPLAQLVADSHGNFYGTTAGGGSAECGVVFEVERTLSGKAMYQVLHDFAGGSDGCDPNAGVAFDASGNLYGTAALGGTNDSGVVFELVPGKGGQWTESILYSFCSAVGCADGGGPKSSLSVDNSGDLYGTAYLGGAQDDGVVFELIPAQGDQWNEEVLYSFTGGLDGAAPQAAALIFDASGNIYGTTPSGGIGSGCGHGCGVVFELLPRTGGQWQESVLYSFTGGNDGAGPSGALIFDGTGNLYGPTAGGGTQDDGTVFELTPGENGQWSETVLHSFAGKDGVSPKAGVAFDSSGNIFGTASSGGSKTDCPRAGCGTLFELMPAGNGQWTESTLHTFAGRLGGNDGATPLAGLVIDRNGTLFGTTFEGGVVGGTLFVLKPADRNRM
jgi:uncharacterized repeat protein (TIGR03803 family)